MTELEFTIEVRNKFKHKMESKKHDVFLCRTAATIRRLNRNAFNVDECYDNFIDWINYIGQILLDDISGASSKYSSDFPWAIPISNYKRRNRFRLDKINERIKELEKYEK